MTENPHTSMTIAGAAVTTKDTFDVIDPATGTVFAQAPAATQEHVDSAMSAAHEAGEWWSADESVRRASLLAAADALDAAAPDLASVLTAEQGKPLADAVAEIELSAVWLRYFGNLDLPAEIIQDDDAGFVEIQRRPLGVVAAITPWNFPVLLAMWKIAPALRVGNTLVVKPSPFTPLTTLALGTVLAQVLPNGVVNVLSGPDPLGAKLTGHALTRKISFTGSTATGKRVAADAAHDLKRVTLELGGNDPAIVLPDAPIHEIADDLFWGAFRNNGQICAAAKRIYVHKSQEKDLVDALAAVARSVQVDAGTVPGAQLGPLNNQPQLHRVSALVADAVTRGARVVVGGARIDRPGYFYEPTILTDVEDGTAIVDEEQFGPALPIIAYEDLTDAVARANRGHYGLTASVWSADPAAAQRVANRIDAGQISLNAHGAAIRPDLPFGGHKWSGIGVENGPWGLNGFTETRVIAGPGRR